MSRKLPPHIVLPNGMWRFIKKGSKRSNPIRKGVSMAKGKYRGKAKAFYKASGGYKSFLAPIAGGAGDVIIQKYIPLFGVGSTVAGMFLNDQVTMKMGLNKIGESLGAMFSGGFGGSANGGL